MKVKLFLFSDGNDTQPDTVDGWMHQINNFISENMNRDDLVDITCTAHSRGDNRGKSFYLYTITYKSVS